MQLTAIEPASKPEERAPEAGTAGGGEPGAATGGKAGASGNAPARGSSSSDISSAEAGEPIGGGRGGRAGLRGVSPQAANVVLQYTSVLKPSIASWSSLRIFLKFAGVRGMPSKNTSHQCRNPQRPVSAQWPNQLSMLTHEDLPIQPEAQRPRCDPDGPREAFQSHNG